MKKYGTEDSQGSTRGGLEKLKIGVDKEGSSEDDGSEKGSGSSRANSVVGKSRERRKSLDATRLENMKNGSAFLFLGECKKECDEGRAIDWTIAQPILRDNAPLPRYLQRSTSEPKSAASSKAFYQSKEISPVLVDISDVYFKEQGIDRDKGNILIGTSILGMFGSICTAFGVTKYPDRKVLIVTPNFGKFQKQCHANQISTYTLQTTAENDWQVDPKVLHTALQENPGTKIAVFNYPNNPTGKIMDKKTALAIAEVMVDFPDVVIVSDEIMADTCLGDKKHFSLGAIDTLKQEVIKDDKIDMDRKRFLCDAVDSLSLRVIVLTGAAKSRPVAACNVAIGYLPNELPEAQRIQDLHGASTMPTLDNQNRVAESLKPTDENREYLAKDIEQYNLNIVHIKDQIKVINKTLNEYFGGVPKNYVKPYIENPESGNAYLLDFSGLKEKSLTNGDKLKTGEDVARFLLYKAGVATVPGECSDIEKEHMVTRIPLATKQEEITKCFGDIALAITLNFQQHAPSSTASIVGGVEQKNALVKTASADSVLNLFS